MKKHRDYSDAYLYLSAFALGLPIALALALNGCVSLPPTKIPVCGERVTWSTQTVCRAPVTGPSPREEGRNYLWEATYACKRPTELFRRCDCYKYAGVDDSRQLYVWAGPCR